MVLRLIRRGAPNKLGLFSWLINKGSSGNALFLYNHGIESSL